MADESVNKNGTYPLLHPITSATLPFAQQRQEQGDRCTGYEAPDDPRRRDSPGDVPGRTWSAA